MRRVIVPLERMGARIESRDGRPPLTVQGTAALSPLDYQTEVPSAQVKSAVLLAGLHAAGRTSVTESLPTRDHTERALAEFGVQVERHGAGTVAVDGRPAADGPRCWRCRATCRRPRSGWRPGRRFRAPRSLLPMWD